MPTEQVTPSSHYMLALRNRIYSYIWRKLSDFDFGNNAIQWIVISYLRKKDASFINKLRLFFDHLHTTKS